MNRAGPSRGARYPIGVGLVLALMPSFAAHAQFKPVAPGSSGNEVALTVRNPNSDVAIEGLRLEVVDRPPWVSSVEVRPGGVSRLAAGAERVYLVRFAIASAAPPRAVGQLILRLQSDVDVLADLSDIPVSLRVRARAPASPEPGSGRDRSQDDATPVSERATSQAERPRTELPREDVEPPGPRGPTGPEPPKREPPEPEPPEPQPPEQPMERVPSLVGETRARAEELLRTRGLVPDPVVDRESPVAEQAGTVYRQVPQAGIDVERGLPVRFWAYEPQTINDPARNAPTPTEGWDRGKRSDIGDGWERGRRSETQDPCRGPRPKYADVMARVEEAALRQDLDAVTRAIAALPKGCAGDAQRLIRLKEAVVRLAEAEAAANEARLRDDLGRARRRRRATRSAWATALTTIVRIRETLDESADGAAGTTGGTGGRSTSGSGGASDEERCLVDSSGDYGGRSSAFEYDYYVEEAVLYGISAYKILRLPRTAQRSPSGGGRTLHGPYGSRREANEALDRLCPPSRRSTDRIDIE